MSLKIPKWINMFRTTKSNLQNSFPSEYYHDLLSKLLQNATLIPKLYFKKEKKEEKKNTGLKMNIAIYLQAQPKAYKTITVHFIKEVHRKST